MPVYSWTKEPTVNGWAPRRTSGIGAQHEGSGVLARQPTYSDGMVFGRNAGWVLRTSEASDIADALFGVPRTAGDTMGNDYGPFLGNDVERTMEAGDCQMVAFDVTSWGLQSGDTLWFSGYFTNDSDGKDSSSAYIVTRTMPNGTELEEKLWYQSASNKSVDQAVYAITLTPHYYGRGRALMGFPYDRHGAKLTKVELASVEHVLDPDKPSEALFLYTNRHDFDQNLRPITVSRNSLDPAERQNLYDEDIGDIYYDATLVTAGTGEGASQGQHTVAFEFESDPQQPVTHLIDPKKVILKSDLISSSSYAPLVTVDTEGYTYNIQPDHSGMPHMHLEHTWDLSKIFKWDTTRQVQGWTRLSTSGKVAGRTGHNPIVDGEFCLADELFGSFDDFEQAEYGPYYHGSGCVEIDVRELMHVTKAGRSPRRLWISGYYSPGPYHGSAVVAEWRPRGNTATTDTIVQRLGIHDTQYAGDEQNQKNAIHRLGGLNALHKYLGVDFEIHDGDQVYDLETVCLTEERCMGGYIIGGHPNHPGRQNFTHNVYLSVANNKSPIFQHIGIGNAWSTMARGAPMTTTGDWKVESNILPETTAGEYGYSGDDLRKRYQRPILVQWEGEELQAVFNHKVRDLDPSKAYTHHKAHLDLKEGDGYYAHKNIRLSHVHRMVQPSDAVDISFPLDGTQKTEQVSYTYQHEHPEDVSLIMTAHPGPRFVTNHFTRTGTSGTSSLANLFDGSTSTSFAIEGDLQIDTSEWGLEPDDGIYIPTVSGAVNDWLATYTTSDGSATHSETGEDMLHRRVPTAGEQRSGVSGDQFDVIREVELTLDMAMVPGTNQALVKFKRSDGTYHPVADTVTHEGSAVDGLKWELNVAGDQFKHKNDTGALGTDDRVGSYVEISGSDSVYESTIHINGRYRKEEGSGDVRYYKSNAGTTLWLQKSESSGRWVVQKQSDMDANVELFYAMSHTAGLPSPMDAMAWYTWESISTPPVIDSSFTMSENMTPYYLSEVHDGGYRFNLMAGTKQNAMFVPPPGATVRLQVHDSNMQAPVSTHKLQGHPPFRFLDITTVVQGVATVHDGAGFGEIGHDDKIKFITSDPMVENDRYIRAMGKYYDRVSRIAYYLTQLRYTGTSGVGHPPIQLSISKINLLTPHLHSLGRVPITDGEYIHPPSGVDVTTTDMQTGAYFSVENETPNSGSVYMSREVSGRGTVKLINGSSDSEMRVRRSGQTYVIAAEGHHLFQAPTGDTLQREDYDVFWRRQVPGNEFVVTTKINVHWVAPKAVVDIQETLQITAQKQNSEAYVRLDSKYSLTRDDGRPQEIIGYLEDHIDAPTLQNPPPASDSVIIEHRQGVIRTWDITGLEQSASNAYVASGECNVVKLVTSDYTEYLLRPLEEDQAGPESYPITGGMDIQVTWSAKTWTATNIALGTTNYIPASDFGNDPGFMMNGYPDPHYPSEFLLHGGSGSGAIAQLVVDVNNNVMDGIKIVVPGSGYKPGDTVTIRFQDCPYFTRDLMLTLRPIHFDRDYQPSVDLHSRSNPEGPMGLQQFRYTVSHPDSNQPSKELYAQLWHIVDTDPPTLVENPNDSNIEKIVPADIYMAKFWQGPEPHNLSVPLQLPTFHDAVDLEVLEITTTFPKHQNSGLVLEGGELKIPLDALPERDMTEIYEVKFTAKDGRGNETEETTTVTVRMPVDEAPEWTMTPSDVFLEDTTQQVVSEITYRVHTNKLSSTGIQGDVVNFEGWLSGTSNADGALVKWQKPTATDEYAASGLPDQAREWLLTDDTLDVIFKGYQKYSDADGTWGPHMGGGGTTDYAQDGINLSPGKYRLDHELNYKYDQSKLKEDVPVLIEVLPTTPLTGLSDGSTNISGGSGSGATARLSDRGDGHIEVSIVNGGQDYKVGDVVRIVGAASGLIQDLVWTLESANVDYTTHNTLRRHSHFEVKAHEDNTDISVKNAKRLRGLMELHMYTEEDAEMVALRLGEELWKMSEGGQSTALVEELKKTEMIDNIEIWSLDRITMHSPTLEHFNKFQKLVGVLNREFRLTEPSLYREVIRLFKFTGAPSYTSGNNSDYVHLPSRDLDHWDPCYVGLEEYSLQFMLFPVFYEPIADWCEQCALQGPVNLVKSLEQKMQSADGYLNPEDHRSANFRGRHGILNKILRGGFEELGAPSDQDTKDRTVTFHFSVADCDWVNGGKKVWDKDDQPPEYVKWKGVIYRSLITYVEEGYVDGSLEPGTPGGAAHWSVHSSNSPDTYISKELMNLASIQGTTLLTTQSSSNGQELEWHSPIKFTITAGVVAQRELGLDDRVTEAEVNGDGYVLNLVNIFRYHYLVLESRVMATTYAVEVERMRCDMRACLEGTNPTATVTGSLRGYPVGVPPMTPQSTAEWQLPKTQQHWYEEEVSNTANTPDALDRHVCVVHSLLVAFLDTRRSFCFQEHATPDTLLITPLFQDPYSPSLLSRVLDISDAVDALTGVSPIPSEVKEALATAIEGMDVSGAQYFLDNKAGEDTAELSYPPDLSCCHVDLGRSSLVRPDLYGSNNTGLRNSVLGSTPHKIMLMDLKMHMNALRTKLGDILDRPLLLSENWKLPKLGSYGCDGLADVSSDEVPATESSDLLNDRRFYDAGRVSKLMDYWGVRGTNYHEFLGNAPGPFSWLPLGGSVPTTGFGRLTCADLLYKDCHAMTDDVFESLKAKEFPLIGEFKKGVEPTGVAPEDKSLAPHKQGLRKTGSTRCMFSDCTQLVKAKVGVDHLMYKLHPEKFWYRTFQGCSELREMHFVDEVLCWHKETPVHYASQAAFDNFLADQDNQDLKEDKRPMCLNGYQPEFHTRTLCHIRNFESAKQEQADGVDQAAAWTHYLTLQKPRLHSVKIKRSMNEVAAASHVYGGGDTMKYGAFWTKTDGTTDQYADDYGHPNFRSSFGPREHALVLHERQGRMCSLVLTHPALPAPNLGITLTSPNVPHTQAQLGPEHGLTGMSIDTLGDDDMQDALTLENYKYPYIWNMTFDGCVKMEEITGHLKVKGLKVFGDNNTMSTLKVLECNFLHHFPLTWDEMSVSDQSSSIPQHITNTSRHHRGLLTGLERENPVALRSLASGTERSPFNTDYQPLTNTVPLPTIATTLGSKVDLKDLDLSVLWSAFESACRNQHGAIALAYRLTYLDMDERTPGTHPHLLHEFVQTMRRHVHSFFARYSDGLGSDGPGMGLTHPLASSLTEYIDSMRWMQSNDHVGTLRGGVLARMNSGHAIERRTLRYMAGLNDTYRELEHLLDIDGLLAQRDRPVLRALDLVSGSGRMTLNPSTGEWVWVEDEDVDLVKLNQKNAMLKSEVTAERKKAGEAAEKLAGQFEKNMYIEEGTTEIQAGHFENNATLVNVVLPRSVTTIHENAFKNCTSLGHINLSEVTTIGAGAFMGCAKLYRVSLSEATMIGEGAFQDCPELSKVESLNLDYFSMTGGDVYNGGDENVFGGTTRLNKLTDLNFLTTVTAWMAGGLDKDNAIEQFGQISNWDVSRVTNMSNAFDIIWHDTASQVFNEDISGWDVGNVTNMDHMFNGASSFNRDISGWEVKNVSLMNKMFGNANSFNQNLSGWDVRNVTSMDRMFLGASSFNQDISGWDVRNVTSMDYMFDGASYFNQDISLWKVGNVTSMKYMFHNAISFDQDISGWDVGNVTNMDYMFSMLISGESSFNQDISGWDVRNVTSMDHMFNGAGSFNQDISGWEVGNVSSMNYMFYNAQSFNQDISGWDMGNVTSMTYMFENAVSFNQAYLPTQ